MNTLRKLASIALVTLAAACGSSDSDSSGGGGSPGGGASGDTSCDGVCNSLFAQKCFYGGGESDCRKSCTGWETQYVAAGADYCKTAWSDWKACITSQSLTCVDDYNPDWNAAPCRQHWDHFQNYCINQNATPDTPCTDNAAFDAFCAGDAAHPKGKSCFGNAPAGCVVGGTSNNASLYCCAP